MSSTIWPARQAVHTMLTATFASTVVQAVIGNPKDYEGQQVVTLLGLSSASEDYALLGGNSPGDERYALNLRIKYHDPAASDGAAVDAAAGAIYDSVRNAVRADPTFGGVLILPARLNTPTSAGAFQPEDASGWAMFIDFTIDCFGRAN